MSPDYFRLAVSLARAHAARVCLACGEPLAAGELVVCDQCDYFQTCDFLGVRPSLSMAGVADRAREKRRRCHNQKQEETR